MAGEKTLLDAVSTIYQALEPLDEESRDRAMASVRALLGMTSATVASSLPAVAQQAQASVTDVSPPSRPVSLVELMQDRNPTTNPQTIALFAYYRDRIEGTPRFARGDLRYYFPRAKLSPPGNYDRDFTTAVKHGWIHEDGSESYLTTRGIEAVESGFTAATPPTAQRSVKRRVVRGKKAPTKKSASTSGSKKSPAKKQPG